MKGSWWATGCFVLLGCSGSTTGTGLNGDGGADQGGGGMFGMGAGTANKDAGAVEKASTTPTSSCGVQSGNATCDACLNQHCCAELTACKSNPDCVGLYRCAAQCSADDSTCFEACMSQFPNGSNDLGTAMSCIDKSCAKECQ